MIFTFTIDDLFTLLAHNTAAGIILGVILSNLTFKRRSVRP